MASGPLFCAYCGARIDPPYTSRRRYCDDSCRQGAMRARRSTVIWEETTGSAGDAFADGLDQSLAGLVPPITAVPLDDQIVRAILEARGLAGAFRRLGIEAQPKLSWRCSGVGKAIPAALDELFGKDMARRQTVARLFRARRSPVCAGVSKPWSTNAASALTVRVRRFRPPGGVEWVEVAA